MKKINKNTQALNLITRFYNIYIEEGQYNEGSFTDYELLLLIKLVLDLRDTSDLESVLC